MLIDCALSPDQESRCCRSMGHQRPGCRPWPSPFQGVQDGSINVSCADSGSNPRYSRGKLLPAHLHCLLEKNGFLRSYLYFKRTFCETMQVNPEWFIGGKSNILFRDVLVLQLFKCSI